MADIRHFINGQDLGEPDNWQGMEITIDWLNVKESGSINLTDLTFNREANQYLQQRILNGLNGGPGIFEGEPYTIQIGNQQTPEYVFEGYLDFTGELTVLGGQEITCGLKRRKGEDWLNDVANGFSFASLHDEGIITESDFVKVPYVINYVPDGMQIVVISMSIYMMTKELIENVQSISEAIADIINASTPVVGVSVGLGAGVVTAWDLGDFALAALKVIARIAYTIAIIVAIINLIDSLFTQLLPARRFHLGMTFRRMFEKACQKLDLQFQSSIEELNWVHIPRKDRPGGTRGETGFPANDGALYLFGDLINVMKQMFNADFRIENGIFYFEREDNFRTPSSYTIPATFNNQERLLQQHQFNTDEMVSNYNILYNYDTQDQNTLNNQEGRVFQAITEPMIKANDDLVNIKNLVQINLPFTMGLDKQSLTSVEQIFRVLGSIVDGLTGIFGGGTNYSSRIRNRVGSLLLSSPLLSIGKVVVMSGANLARNQRQLLDTRILWDKYHFIRSFALYQGQHNQFKRFAEQPVGMTFKEFVILLSNNITEDENGNEVRIERVVYNPYFGEALIDYRVKEIYTNNLQIKII